MAAKSKKTATETAPTKRAPLPREVEAIDTAKEVLRKRRLRPSVEFDPNDKNTVVGRHSDDTGATIHRMIDAYGTTSLNAEAIFTGQLEYITRYRGADRGDTDVRLNAGLAVVASVEPKNEIEACLAIQMAGTHSLATEMLGHARHTDDLERLERYVAMANKLQRTFAMQMEALSKIRSGGKQTVEVKYLDARNSQNIIADQVVTGGGKSRSDSEPHATAAVAGLAFAPGMPVRGQNAEGYAVPGAGNSEQEAVQDARWQQPGSADRGAPSPVRQRPAHKGDGSHTSSGRRDAAQRAKSAGGDQG